jgi:tripeptide aminopeptidase
MEFPVNADRLLERFLRYVQVETTANDASSTYPSSPGQLVLGKMLAEELQQMGLADVKQDEHGLVWGTIHGNISHAAPTIAFNAHVDTSPETTAANVRPQVIRDYGGGDIALPEDPSKVIRLTENPELVQLIGKTIITTDGTTLLGSDDKSGVAVIMEFAQTLMEQSNIPHGPVKVLFTCDEEIGRGAQHVDYKKLAATACYTLDGQGAGEIDVETFSADGATVKITGVNIHPSIGKGRMVNAIRAAGKFLDRLPREGMSPETTDGRQGFMHPYDMAGGVAETTIRILLRDFDTAGLQTKAELLKKLAAEVQQECPGTRIEVEVKKQYRNMADGLKKEPRAVRLAEEAFKKLGRPCKQTIIRGGTDGSQFTERGLPTPNLSTGEHNPHSPLEWTCLEEMTAAVEVLVELAQLWGAEKA